jgi:hypothetical protein
MSTDSSAAAELCAGTRMATHGSWAGGGGEAEQEADLEGTAPDHVQVLGYGPQLGCGGGAGG